MIRNVLECDGCGDTLGSGDKIAVGSYDELERWANKRCWTKDFGAKHYCRECSRVRAAASLTPALPTAQQSRGRKTGTKRKG